MGTEFILFLVFFIVFCFSFHFVYLVNFVKINDKPNFERKARQADVPNLLYLSLLCSPTEISKSSDLELAAKNESARRRLNSTALHAAHSSPDRQCRPTCNNILN